MKKTQRRATPAKTKAIVAEGAKALNAMNGAEGPKAYQNGLGAAIGAPSYANGGFGFPFNQGSPWTEQLSNVNTIFKNLRWYLVSNFRQVLSEIYVEIGLVQTIVDVPTDDAFRGGVEIKSKQLDEDQIDELQTSLERDDDYEAASIATKWNRLFGGAGVLIITDQDPTTPLDVDAIDKDTPLQFRGVDMWELYFDIQNTEGPGPQLIGEGEEDEFYSYYGTRIHKSRVLPLTGLTAPSFIRPRLRGWGYSVVEKLVRSINQYLKATDLGFEVLDEFKLDVYKIKNLTNSLLSPAGEEQIRRRVQLANWQKNYQNAIVMDSEDDFDHKQLSFAGLAEAMQGIRMQVASDMRMPLTKLFGISAAGFNSGEDDIEVYNAMVESEVRSKIKWHLLRMIEIKCQKLFGFVPDDLRISFKPLRMLSAEQEENVKTQRFTRLLQAKQAGEVTRYEFREGCNKDNLLSITLDNAGDELNPDDPDIVDHVEGIDEVDLPGGGADEEDDESAVISAKKVGGATTDNRTKKKKTAPEAKVANELKPFTPLQATERAMAVKFKNSSAFDRASYAADGGDAWIDPRKREFYENPTGKVDEALWRKAKDATHAAFGKDKWQFTVWFYLKHGGKFYAK